MDPRTFVFCTLIWSASSFLYAPDGGFPLRSGFGSCKRACPALPADKQASHAPRISLRPVARSGSSWKSPSMVAWGGSDGFAGVSTGSDMTKKISLRPNKPVTIVVFGASGDLAKKKTFPALFSLFYHNLLPKEFQIIGYARKELDDTVFKQALMEKLSCRVDPTHFGPFELERCNKLMNDFLDRVTYFSGAYDDSARLSELGLFAENIFESKLKETGVNRLFYLAVPPTVFADAARSIKLGGLAPYGDTRVIIEKPFGRDSSSYEKLSSDLARELTEEQIYRIDHYLGKELVQNIMALRFANLIFEPLWDNKHIESVQIDFKEPFGVEGRAGYFDQSGIIRDIMQNHLMQVLALLAMEEPSSMDADDVRDEKVKLLRSIETLKPEDFCLGQYVASHNKPGYHEDKEVPADSVTATFAACVLKIKNRRWDGVPFMMRAGKALNQRLAQVLIKFKPVPGAIMGEMDGMTNELVIRLQPDEAIYMSIVNKKPGLTSELTKTNLMLSYKSEWDEAKDLPDAYERLILDALNQEKALFCRDDELKEAWRIFNDALVATESRAGPKPAKYTYGSHGPDEMHILSAKHKAKWHD